MKSRIGILIGLATMFLVGCASPPQQPVNLAKDALRTSANRVGVVMTATPKADTYLPGADCLLCMAVASVANSSLTEHTRTLSNDDVTNLKSEVAALIRKKGADVVEIAENLDIKTLADNKSTSKEVPNVAMKDFSPLRDKHKIDKLLVIDVSALGFIRTYASYIPTSDPKGLLRGVGYLVDLKTNTYEWYLPFNVMKSSDATWDEPPKFPGLTNAYFQAIEMGKDSVLQSLGD